MIFFGGGKGGGGGGGGRFNQEGVDKILNLTCS